MRRQYHFQPAASGFGRFDAWDVDRLIGLSASLPVESVDVATLAEVDTAYWSDLAGSPWTVRRLAEHVRYIRDADLAYPIIRASDGRVMDGMHRVARALIEGRSHIAGRRFTEPLPPDHRDVMPDDLSYLR